jgi:hypothetical protein
MSTRCKRGLEGGMLRRIKNLFIMRHCLITTFFCIAFLTSGKSQSSNSSSFLNFTSYQRMVVYFDSTGKFEMTMGWEKSTDKITIDAFGNRIKLKNTSDAKERLFVLGVKGNKYKSSGIMYIIPFFQCSDDKETRCNIRLMLQDTDNVGKHPSYLYIDYSNVTYLYQLFLD